MAHIVFSLEDGSEIHAVLNADIVTVGRHPESMVVLPNGSVSGQHATIKRRGGSYFVQDLGTTNGTRVNGVDVEEVKLEHGDLVSFGDISGYFYADEGSEVADASASWEGQGEVPGAEESSAPAFLPEPDEPVVAAEVEPSVLLPEKYSAVPRAPKTQRPTGYLSGPSMKPVKKYKESSGFGGFVLFVLFLLFAFVVGLHVRHGQEHSGSILLVDVIQKLREDQAGKVETTEAAGEDPANGESEKPATATPAPAPSDSMPSSEAPLPAPTPAPAPAAGEMSGGSSMMGGEMSGGSSMMGGEMAPAMQ